MLFNRTRGFFFFAESRDGKAPWAGGWSEYAAQMNWPTDGYTTVCTRRVDTRCLYTLADIYHTTRRIHQCAYNSTLSRVDTTKRHTSAKTTAVPRSAIAVSGVHHGVSLDLHDDRSAVAWLHGPGEVFLPRLIRPWPIESPTAPKTV